MCFEVGMVTRQKTPDLTTEWYPWSALSHYGEVSLGQRNGKRSPSLIRYDPVRLVRKG